MKTIFKNAARLVEKDKLQFRFAFVTEVHFICKTKDCSIVPRTVINRRSSLRSLFNFHVLVGFSIGCVLSHPNTLALSLIISTH
jgi:hypothetical protein